MPRLRQTKQGGIYYTAIGHVHKVVNKVIKVHPRRHKKSKVVGALKFMCQLNNERNVNKA